MSVELPPFQWGRAGVGTVVGVAGVLFLITAFDGPGWLWLLVPLCTVSCGWPREDGVGGGDGGADGD